MKEVIFDLTLMILLCIAFALCILNIFVSYYIHNISAFVLMILSAIVILATLIKNIHNTPKHTHNWV